MAAQAARIGGPPGRRIVAARRLGGRGRRRENADGQGPVGRSPTAVRGPQQDAVEADGAGHTGDRTRVLVEGQAVRQAAHDAVGGRWIDAIGRAAGRARGCKYVSNSVGAGSSKKKQYTTLYRLHLNI